MKTSFIASVVFLLLITEGSQTKAQEQQTSTESGLVGKFGLKGGLNFTKSKADITDINDNGTVDQLVKLNEDSFKRWMPVLLLELVLMLKNSH